MSAPFLLCLQLGLYAGLWLIAAQLISQDLVPMRHWAAYAAMSALAMAGLAWRPEGPLWLTGPCVGMASLLSVQIASRGTELFLGRQPRDREHLAVAGVALVGLIWLGPEATHGHGRVALSCGLIAGVMGRALQVCWRPLVAEYGPTMGWAAAAPVLAMALLHVGLALHAGLALSRGVEANALPPPSAWVSTLIAAAAFNFLFLFLLVRRLHQRLQHQARHDPLTDLLNRRAMTHVLEAEWQRWQRLGTPFTLVGLDVDHFKQVNDQHGHEAGDRVLCALASCLRQSLRGVDRLARMGGEEFLVMLPGCRSDSDGRRSAERLRSALADCVVTLAPDLQLRVSASWGVAGPQAGDESLAMVVQRVDAAVYHAKREGRDRVVVQTVTAAAVPTTVSATMPTEA